MPVLFLDFETYYDDAYSLRKMPPPNYILDPRYETIGCAVAVDDGPSEWIDGPDFPAWLAQFDPATCTTVTFNALFDNCILAWRYGFVPSLMLCSMRMAGALYGHRLSSVSLASVCKFFKIGEKGGEIALVKGMRRPEIMNNPALWNGFKNYAINDNDKSRMIFDLCLPDFPRSERKVMDRVIRCSVLPQFRVDKEMLRQHLVDLETEKRQIIYNAMGPEATFSLDDPFIDDRLASFASTLRSAPKFKALLEQEGIEVAMKPSTSDPKLLIPAFAKTDEFMAELQEHDDSRVQALAAARLGLRSTIEQTRGTKILSIADLQWDSYRHGNFPGDMPVPLRYSAAHTHRLGGDWGINMQNLPAGRGGKISKLRTSLLAPPGHKVLVADLAQIECRLNGWLCGQESLLQIFRRGGDPYAALAESVFGYPIDKNVHKVERFIGKTGVLGLGFGCGVDKFDIMVTRSARMMGLDLGDKWNHNIAQTTVTTYRGQNDKIYRAWGELDNLLKTVWLGRGAPRRIGPGGVVEVGHGYVRLPNDMTLNYGSVRHDPLTEECMYEYGGRSYRMYGPKFLENIVQALARVVVMNAALRLWDRGYKFCLQAHDELAFIVPEADVEEAKRVVLEEMVRPPSWARDIPLAAEANYGDSYGDAK